jgi:hypothetical protein
VLDQVVDVADAQQVGDLGVGGLLAEVADQVAELADGVDGVVGGPVEVGVLGVGQVLGHVPVEADVVVVLGQLQGPVTQGGHVLGLEEGAVVAGLGVGGH